MTDSSPSDKEVTEAPTTNHQSNDQPPEQVRDRKALTRFHELILEALLGNGGSDYGLGIKRTLESPAYYNSEVNHGRLYPNLDTLVELDLLDKSELDKRTNEYELTKEGYGVLRASLRRRMEQAGVPEPVIDEAVAHVTGETAGGV